MSKQTAIQAALLTFGIAIVAGLAAGNSNTTVLTRALICMALALGVGSICAALTRLVLRDAAQHRLRVNAASSADGHGSPPPAETAASTSKTRRA